MKFASIAAAALIIVGVSAQTSPPIISVTAPLQGASYKAGDKAIISWINPTVDTISQIMLAQGPGTALQPVNTIATNVQASTGSYTWNIPADLPAGSNYAFEFGTSPNLAFTGQFSITGGAPGASGSSSSNNSSISSGTPPSSGSSAPSSGSSAPSSGSSVSVPSPSSHSSGSSSAVPGSGASPSSSAAKTLSVSSIGVIGVVAVVAITQLI